MKNQIKIAIIAGILAFASCSKDATIEETETANLSTKISLTAKEQTPNAAFDNGKKGIYTGIIAAGNTQDRGVIWINAENNGTYTAYAEMVGGEIINYTAQGNLSQETANMSFEYLASNSSFTLDLSNAKATVTNVTLNNELYFIQVAKATSTRMPATRTGTFNDPNDASFNGTWNLMTNGVAVPTPNGFTFGHEELSLVMITINGNQAIDDQFETFNNCLEGPNYTPSASFNNDIYADGQTSTFFATTTWSLSSLLGGGLQYMDAISCTAQNNGVFTWNGSTPRTGIIFVD